MSANLRCFAEQEVLFDGYIKGEGLRGRGERRARGRQLLRDLLRRGPRSERRPPGRKIAFQKKKKK